MWAEAGVGAVATQAIVDVSYGPRRSRSPAAAHRAPGRDRPRLGRRPDPRPDDWTKYGRQFAVINDEGEAAAYTGPEASPWAGHMSCDQQRNFCTAQGNILAGPEVVSRMVEAYEATPGQLSFRRLAALETGQKA